MRWSLLWNHWFWVTLLISGGIKLSIGESLAVEGAQLAQEPTAVDQLMPLPAGARGGRLVVIPATSPLQQQQQQQQLNSNVQVSQSVSVSKVSVKMGGISSSGVQHQQQQQRNQLLSEISDIYEDPELSNSLAPVEEAGWSEEPPPRPEFRRLDLVGPLSQPLNSLGYEDTKIRPMEKPLSFLESLISKLKSLALTTTANIRVSAGLSPLDNNSTATVAPLAKEPEPVVAQISAEDYPAYQDYYYGGEGTYPPEYYEELPATTNLPLEQDQEAKTTFEEAERDEAAQPEAEPSISLHSEESSLSEDARDSSRERSAYARGRSLPLELLDQLPRLPPLLPEDHQSAGAAKEERVGPLEIVFIEEERPLGSARDQEEQKEEEEQEEEEEEEAAIVESIALLRELESGDRVPLPGGATDIQITYDDGDNVVGISSIVGMVLGIIIFVIIAAVVLLLAVYRGRYKQKKVQDDVISQSSYMSNMTYATTISEHSVNYGPAWEKEACPEDLCSLDNDSFLNSLEAVTAEYWVDANNKGTHKL